MVATVPCTGTASRTVYAVANPATCLVRARYDLALSGNATETAACDPTGTSVPVDAGAAWTLVSLADALESGVATRVGTPRPCLWNERPEGGNFTGMAYEPCYAPATCTAAATYGRALCYA